MISRLKLKRKKSRPPNEEIKDEGKSSLRELKHKTMFEKAIESAKKHKINLKPGRENNGMGNCSYEAVIFNINDRGCFHSKLNMSLEHYRVVWNTDMMNKVLDKRVPWNPGLTRQDIVQGFQELMISGVYERDFFGDMIMAGIACGVRKIILIFHTNEDISKTGHDPVSVIDPRDYAGDIDSEIPVVVAYNLVHYESLLPLCEDDVEEILKLVRSYMAKPSKYQEEYGFSGKDISYLVSKDENILKLSPGQLDNPSKKIKTNENEINVSQKKDKKEDEAEGFIFEDILFKNTEDGKVICGVCQVECSRLIVHMNGNDYCTEYFSNMDTFKLEFSKYRHRKSKRSKAEKIKDLEISIENEGSIQDTKIIDNDNSKRSKTEYGQSEEDRNNGNKQNNENIELFTYEGIIFEELPQNKVRCGICMMECGRLIVHLNGSKKCAENISNMASFKIEYSKYRHRQRSNKTNAKKKAEDPQGFKERVNEWKKKQEAKQKLEDLKGFNENANKRKRIHAAKKKVEDLQGFKEKVNEWKKKQEAKQKLEDTKVFNENANKRKRKHDAKKKVQDPQGFKEKVNERKKKQEAKQKLEDLKVFNDNANKRKRIHAAKKKIEDPQGFKEKVNEWKMKQEAKQKSEDPDSFAENAKKRKRAHVAKKKAEDPKGFKEKVNEWKKISNSNISAAKRLAKFRRRVKFGPIFVCSCCHQKLFENQVQILTDDLRSKIDEGDPEIRNKCIEDEIKIEIEREELSYLCKACLSYLKRGKLPKLCVKNGLQVDEIDDDLVLTELENNLIARNIIFQKIHKLPKSRWSGTHDRLVNVPVGPQDVLNTIEKLPRTPIEAGLIPIIPVNLKRKLEYKTTHLTQMIDTNKIFKYLDYIRKKGHPSYKFYDDWNAYEKRCFTEDPRGAVLIFPEAENEIVDLEIYREDLKESDMSEMEEENEGNDINIEQIEKDKNEEEEYVKKDPVRKYQYDYNITTCMTNKFPEADSGSALNFAPAEGKIPTCILRDDDWDINSFPNLYPTGKNKMFQEREIKLTPQQFLTQRFKNKNTRFVQCTPYVFASAAYLEEKQMERNIGVSYRKGKIDMSTDGSKTYKLEDAYSVLDDVKSTPKFWKKAKMEILGKIDNFGPFHWFYTLSCADMRWDENFTSILREKGYKIIWNQKYRNDVGTEDKASENQEDVGIQVEFTINGKTERRDLEYFLKNECEESLHEFIRTNVFIATRNFVHRVKAFRTEIMMGCNNPLRIKYWSDKMEFQGRGAGHIHGVAWSDLKEVSKLIEKEKEVGIILSNGKDKCDIEENDKNGDLSNLEKAYKSLRENIPLNDAEEKALIDFVDRSVTCTLNPDMAAKMIDVKRSKRDGLKIINIVKECLNHYHTKACRKYGTPGCRFRFPKFPMWKTILTRNDIQAGDTDSKKERLEEQKEVLEKVQIVLEQTEIVDDIMNSYDKENENIDEYRHNRKDRILRVLELAGVEPEEYETALRESSRKGINVILARDFDELYVNNYNPEWVEAWDGNIDFSPVFDFFAVVTYVTEYFTKDESGTSSFLAEASKQMKALPIKDQKRCIKNVFLTHRQMGLSEAYMKIFADMRLKDSNIGSEFVPLGKKEDVSRYLMRADPDIDYMDKELIQIEGKDGLYYEKPNWIEKYWRRDMSEWNELCFPQYVKMFDPCRSSGKNEDDDEGHPDDEEDDSTEDGKTKDPTISNIEKDKIKYGQEVKFHYLITETGEMGKPLPKIIELKNPYPGEPRFLKKRRNPKSLRFYKVKKDLNPARYFLHELMMYKHFSKEDYERWHDDEKCLEDYEKFKDIIKNVKGKVMEWMEDVEEARYFVEEIMKDGIDIEEVGEDMDPEKHKEDIDCEIEGPEEDEQYVHLDPEGRKGLDFPACGNWFRKLDLLDIHVLEQQTCRLDRWQRKVVDVGLMFVKGLKKNSGKSARLTKPENLVVIGGAGSGKSTVIECLAQWCHRILVKSGDDPNSPYILKAATTGAASTLIEGTTVHSSLGFDFSSKHTSLSDKKRDLKREQLKNLKILIIDEFSMLKADILYRIDLRLREITQNKQDFGGVLVFLFGDPAQLKPVRGSYIFSAPNCKDYKLAYGDGTESLWRSFDVINLNKNHRQGKDKDYADLLNRVRLGKHTKEDIGILDSRVRTKGHEDLKNTLFISAKVDPVTKYNKNALTRLSGKLHVCKATHFQALTKSFKPKIDKAGRIGDTQYVDALNLKMGARVMLIFNIDVSDLLCNGSIGTIIGIEDDCKGTVRALVVKFDKPEAGRESRANNPVMAKKYPGGTVIKKMEKEYSLTRNQGLISSTAKLIQFPIVLAWAVTVHKFQGQTVAAPQKVAIDLRSVFEAAQAYVMMSRVQELEQLYILEELPEDKIYANNSAMEEINRLIQVSKNMNLTEWDKENDIGRMKVCFLNCRSIQNKFHNIKSDRSLLKSDVLILIETWLTEDTDTNPYALQDYDSSFNNRGRGKGIASYFRGNFGSSVNINDEGFSITKLENKKVTIIGVYRSQTGDLRDLTEKLEGVVDTEVTTIVGGDFNICALEQGKNFLTARLSEMGFKQIVMEATHIDGGVIDHIYILHGKQTRFEWALELMPKYYSDHDGVCLTLWEICEEQK